LEINNNIPIRLINIIILHLTSISNKYKIKILNKYKKIKMQIIFKEKNNG